MRRPLGAISEKAAHHGKRFIAGDAIPEGGGKSGAANPLPIDFELTIIDGRPAALIKHASNGATGADAGNDRSKGEWAPHLHLHHVVGGRKPVGGSHDSGTLYECGCRPIFLCLHLELEIALG